MIKMAPMHESQPAAPTSAPAVPSVVPTFDDAELAALDSEDVQAGRVIARLLCFFFLYTIVVCAIAGWWTWKAIS